MSKLDALTLDDLNINPYLIATMNLTTPEQIIYFYVDQYFTRSIVTAFGSVFQTISQMFGEAAKMHDIDILFKRNGKNHFVQLKSGPEGFTGPALRRTVERLEQVKKQDPNCETIIAFAYGTHRRLSPVWRKELKADRVLVGREFWEFVLQEKDRYKVLFDLAKKAGIVKENTIEETASIGKARTLESVRSDAIKRILEQWEQKYGKGESSIRNMLEDNV